ncbi:MAG TPA: amidoligase family protein [Mycobacteriales bacterium]|nr:amidoligase family protein [Mycobacteriales bacterium]
MSEVLRRRIGFELELLAPKGSSRRTLADALAARCRGSVRSVWHLDSEPTPVQSLGGRFLHLTQGFEVRRASRDVLCTLVDDVTISADLDLAVPPASGWHRLLTDDLRLAWLLERRCDPAASLDVVLDPVAQLWGETVEVLGDVRRLDARGATVALAAPSGGERERPCEIVTPPIDHDHAEALEELLGPARELGFTVPREAAVHLHLDGKPFRDAATLANVVRLFAHWREPLRQRLGTNPECRRLKPLPDELVAAADGEPSYDELRDAAKRSGLTKFYDINLTQLFRDDPIRDTLEIRILPGAITAGEVIAKASMIEALLDRCEQGPRLDRLPRDGEMMRR